jgi:hypothetical protein
LPGWSTRVPLHRPADERAGAQSKTPGKILRPADADPRIGHDRYIVVGPGEKTVRGVGAEIDLMMPFRDRERLGQSSWTGTKAAQIINPAAFSHQLDAASGFQRADEDDAVTRSALQGR